MSTTETYFVTAGVPFTSGPGFLTPLFLTAGRSNSLFYQDIGPGLTIRGFRPAPQKAADRGVGISSPMTRREKDPALFAFRDLSGHISVNSMEGLSSKLRAEFRSLENYPHLQKSIATALNDAGLLEVARRSLHRRNRGEPTRVSNLHIWNANLESIDNHKQVLFPITARALEDLAKARNALLVGARGMGKTLVLKLIKDQIESTNRPVLWVSGGTSFDTPISIALAAAYAQHQGNIRDLYAKIMTQVRFAPRLQIDDIAVLRTHLDEVMAELMHSEVTVIVDDIHLFETSPHWPKELADDRFLKDLFRSRRPNVIAATSDVVGYHATFGQKDFRSPTVMHDYAVITMSDVSRRLDDKTREAAIAQFEQMFPNHILTASDFDRILNYVPANNPRQILGFCQDIMSSGRIGKRQLKTLHNRITAHRKKMLSYCASRLGQVEFDKQISMIAESAREQMIRRDRAGRPPTRSSVFKVRLDGDTSVLAMLACNGMLILEVTQPSEGRARFLTGYDEAWFVDHYGMADSSKKDDPSTDEPGLF